jgi:glycosyltransferase involved in cell wall biosynthesis
MLPFPDREFPLREEIWRQLALPAFFTLHRTDVYHLPAGHYLTPWPRVRRIYTVHDLRSFHIQDAEPQNLELMRRSCRAADQIITVSDFTRQDVIEHYGIPERKVTTVHLGVDEAFGVVDDPPAVEAMEQRLGIQRPFLLSLGLVPRKNVERLVEAYARFSRREEIALVLAGHPGGPWVEQLRRRISELGLERLVRMPGAPSLPDLVLLYNAALGFVFPSLCEGFGIPVLEAMACGAPVITSNLSALPEIVGEAALLVDPHDTESITAAMERLADDAELRRGLTEAGQKRAAHFSWERMARGLLREYTR